MSTEAPEVEVEPPLLELIGVRTAYGRIEVLTGVDLVVPKGKVVALLGPNGGGKTTTLKVASGQMPATAGCIHLGGRHVNGVAPDALARIGVCTIPEGRGVFPNLTVRENLRMVTFGGIKQKDVEDKAFTRFGRVPRSANQLDDLVEVIERDLQPFEDVGAGLGFAQLELGPAPHDFAAELDELIDDLNELQHARPAAADRQHDDAERRLQLGVLVQVVEHDFRHFAALQLHDDAHAVPVRLVAQI